MNSPPSPRPRFVCRVVRLWHSVFGPPHPGPAAGGRSRHIEACTDCQQYFHAGDEVESALRRDAAQGAPVFPDGLERRIMQAVAQSTRTLRPTRSPRALILAGSAVAAVALVVFLVHRYPAGSAHDGKLANRSAQINDVVTVAESISDLLRNSVVPSARTLVADNPLQQELDSVYSDTRSALNFLALNFLPTSPARPALPPTGATSSRRS